MECLCAADGAWYPISTKFTRVVSTSNGARLRVRYKGFPSDEDELLDLPDLHARLKLECKPVQDEECRNVHPDSKIMVLVKYEDGSRKYHLAKVIDVSRKRHPAAEGECTCTFIMGWDKSCDPAGKVQWPDLEEPMRVAIEDMCFPGGDSASRPEVVRWTAALLDVFETNEAGARGPSSAPQAADRKGKGKAAAAAASAAPSATTDARPSRTRRRYEGASSKRPATAPAVSRQTRRRLAAADDGEEAQQPAQKTRLTRVRLATAVDKGAVPTPLTLNIRRRLAGPAVEDAAAPAVAQEQHGSEVYHTPEGSPPTEAVVAGVVQPAADAEVIVLDSDGSDVTGSEAEDDDITELTASGGAAADDEGAKDASQPEAADARRHETSFAAQAPDVPLPSSLRRGRRAAQADPGPSSRKAAKPARTRAAHGAAGTMPASAATAAAADGGAGSCAAAAAARAAGGGISGADSGSEVRPFRNRPRRFQPQVVQDDGEPSRASRPLSSWRLKQTLAQVPASVPGSGQQQPGAQQQQNQQQQQQQQQQQAASTSNVRPAARRARPVKDTEVTSPMPPTAPAQPEDGAGLRRSVRAKLTPQRLISSPVDAGELLQQQQQHRLPSGDDADLRRTATPLAVPAAEPGPSETTPSKRLRAAEAAASASNTTGTPKQSKRARIALQQQQQQQQEQEQPQQRADAVLEDADVIDMTLEHTGLEQGGGTAGFSGLHSAEALLQSQEVLPPADAEVPATQVVAADTQTPGHSDQQQQQQQDSMNSSAEEEEEEAHMIPTKRNRQSPSRVLDEEPRGVTAAQQQRMNAARAGNIEWLDPTSMSFPDDWRISRKEFTSAKTKGRKQKTYFAPDGRLARSQKEARAMVSEIQDGKALLPPSRSRTPARARASTPADASQLFADFAYGGYRGAAGPTARRSQLPPAAAALEHALSADAARAAAVLAGIATGSFVQEEPIMPAATSVSPQVFEEQVDEAVQPQSHDSSGSQSPSPDPQHVVVDLNGLELPWADILAIAQQYNEGTVRLSETGRGSLWQAVLGSDVLARLPRKHVDKWAAQVALLLEVEEAVDWARKLTGDGLATGGSSRHPESGPAEATAQSQPQPSAARVPSQRGAPPGSSSAPPAAVATPPAAAIPPPDPLPGAAHAQPAAIPDAAVRANMLSMLGEPESGSADRASTREVASASNGSMRSGGRRQPVAVAGDAPAASAPQLDGGYGALQQAQSTVGQAQPQRAELDVGAVAQEPAQATPSAAAPAAAAAQSPKASEADAATSPTAAGVQADAPHIASAAQESEHITAPAASTSAPRAEKAAVAQPATASSDAAHAAAAPTTSQSIAAAVTAAASHPTSAAMHGAAVLPSVAAGDDSPAAVARIHLTLLAATRVVTSSGRAAAQLSHPTGTAETSAAATEYAQAVAVAPVQAAEEPAASLWSPAPLADGAAAAAGAGSGAIETMGMDSQPQPSSMRALQRDEGEEQPEVSTCLLNPFDAEQGVHAAVGAGWTQFDDVDALENRLQADQLASQLDGLATQDDALLENAGRDALDHFQWSNE